MEILPGLVFYLFSAVLVAAALMVIAARNPVHAVLFLVLCFFNAAGLFVLMGAEFIAMILVIVYVGAVAVLFLFVVMMLDIDFRELRHGFLSYMPIGALVGLIILAELGMGLATYGAGPDADGIVPVSEAEAPGVENTVAIGRVLYTSYIYPFQVSGLVLLVAMIGAIVLTLRHKPDVRRQKLQQQLARRRNETVEIRQVESGKGVS
ncbi:MAG: NADH-quinone oxidoreductase subunit J [Alphaproteobacteria bacterium]|nr:NADH-quinone oxidoreductase subunit J [Alphaproteobacteria bacterium]